MLNDKVTVNYADHLVTSGVKPAEEVSEMNPGKVYFWYSANQIRSTRGGFSGKVLHGSYTDFFLTKNLKEAGQFLNGLKEGEWRQWNEQGILLNRTMWKCGQKTGPYYVYNAEGKSIESGSYKNGLQHGKRAISKGDSVQVSWFREGKAYKPSKKLSKFIKKLNPFHKDK
jgi:antitoxin component YwqK of YwqJK toxin-antitoxin module